MSNANIEWIKLRFIIALMGEYQNWWSAKIITGKGEDFLAYILPKTKAKAAHQLTTEICRIEHDKQIGSGRYHIFRLPQNWEEKIFRELATTVGEFKVLTEKELLEELFKLSEGITISNAKGPVLIGSSTELNDESVFRSIARHYHEAFKNNYKTYPYLN